MKYTYIDKNPYDETTFLLFFENNIEPFKPCSCCRHVLGARLLGLSYATYLRYCRDVYGAEIRGKGEKYPIPLFKSETKAKQLAELLDKRISELVP